MNQEFWHLTVLGEFSSSHALRHYQGKCENIHGHNFAVELTIKGNVLHEKIEYLMDFSLLKKMLRSTLEKLDHKDLNSTPPFDTINPTSENISRYIAKEIAEQIKEPNVQVYSVKVAEKAGQSATYFCSN